MTARLANPAPQFFTNTNPALPLSGGKMFFFEPGGLTPKDTYSDNALGIPNTNPVILSASGLLPNVFLDGAYRVILAPSTLDNAVVTGGTFTPSQIIWDRDDVNSITTPFSPWVPTYEYGEGGNNIVLGSDGNHYVSKVDNNLGNDPVSSPDEWQIIQFFSGTQEQSDNLLSFAAVEPDLQHIAVGTGEGWESTALAQLFPNYIGGLNTAVNATDAAHDIDIAAGLCADSTNARLIQLAALTKRIDATWAAGSGNGGMASGVSLSPNTTYHLFAIVIDDVADAIFDSSIACANGVSGNDVTHFRRIASVMTDGSSAIVGYIQDGDNFERMAVAQDVNVSNPGLSALTATLSIPTDVALLAKVYGALILSSGTQIGYLLLSSLASTDTAAWLGANQGLISGVSATSILCLVPTNEDAEIRYRMGVNTGTSANFTVQINTQGWIDRRGA